ncbi:MAG: hypothetical protein WBC90_14275 [Albidovulum sp.]
MGADSRSIYLHMGGQTAGAEDVVVYLAANRAGLRRAGFGLYCFDPASSGPDSLAACLPGLNADEAAVAAAAASLSARFGPDRRAGADGFVISASDLAGPSADLLLGRFYPKARMRARILRRALGSPLERLVMVAEPYETLFHAVWMAAALDRRMDPFAEYAEALTRFQGGWADLAEIMMEELEPRELIIQARPTVAAQTLSDLLPGLTLRQPVKPHAKPPLTPSAVAMAQRCMAQGLRLAPGQRDRLVAFHARQKQVEPDLGLSALALADLRGRYVSDLDALARHSAVTVIGDQIPAMAAE